ncbi:MAG: MerR family DNA-binding transcriptional regulator [Rhodospirillaceae bacterium]|nr:MerR family DNA-binding transcriptional regulator [Rhodospirillaceae bacterium]
MNNAPAEALKPASEKFYSTNQLAEDAGVTARTVRFYEGRGLLNPQLAGSTRVYTHSDRARLQIILRGKRLGFSLDEIQEYLNLYNVDAEHIGQVRHIQRKARERADDLRTKLKDIEYSLRQLEQIERDATDRLLSKGVNTDSSAPSLTSIPRTETQKEGMDP